MVEEYPYEYTEDLEEQEEDSFDRQQDLLDESSYKPKEDLYSLFWKVVKASNSSKVGNLTDTELGLFDISVRDCQKIALLGELLDHKGFGNFFLAQGEITLATSASKSGWLPELFVSQRKYTTRTKKKELGIQSQQPKKKFSFFKKKDESI